MKVLLMAYECSPYRGSEWAVGWGRLLEAARVAETHVVTSESNYKALERARDEGLIPAGVRFYTPEPDATLREMEKKPALFAYNYTAYHHWQKLAIVMVRELHARERFDVVQQVNVCTFREPGYAWELGIPFVWGPVGGTQNFPVRFLTMLPAKEAFKELARGVSNWISLRTKKRVREAAKATAVVFAANSTNQRDYERVFGRKVELLLETGLRVVEEPDRSRFVQRVEDQREGRVRPLRILWSGEFQSRKALPVLLRALARVRVPVELRVLGDGPMWETWVSEAEALSLEVVALQPGSESPDPGHPVVDETVHQTKHRNRVEFLGRLPFAEAVAQMSGAELFCFTSLRDTSGNVVLEAMAAGVPVVCFDHQGAGDMVSAESGVKLPVSSPAQAVEDWARTIEALATDAERLLRLSMGATEQARKFLWSANGDRVNSVYQKLAGTAKEGFAAGVADETMGA
jgi:glycosyltransferase involved in cell wall biosynthesis